MTIENSALNRPAALRDGTRASRKGGSGNGNNPSPEVLEAGFSSVNDRDRAPSWLDSLDMGMDMSMDMGMGTSNDEKAALIDLPGATGPSADIAGFLGRPHGYER